MKFMAKRLLGKKGRKSLEIIIETRVEVVSGIAIRIRIHKEEVDMEDNIISNRISIKVITEEAKVANSNLDMVEIMEVVSGSKDSKIRDTKAAVATKRTMVTTKETIEKTKTPNNKRKKTHISLMERTTRQTWARTKTKNKNSKTNPNKKHRV